MYHVPYRLIASVDGAVRNRTNSNTLLAEKGLHRLHQEIQQRQIELKVEMEFVGHKFWTDSPREIMDEALTACKSLVDNKGDVTVWKTEPSARLRKLLPDIKDS